MPRGKQAASEHEEREIERAEDMNDTDMNMGQAKEFELSMGITADDDPSTADMRKIQKSLSADFDESELDFRPGRGNERLAYVKAQRVQERLDSVVGWENWTTEFRVVDNASAAVLCTLTVLGVVKQDIGHPNNPMGAMSQSGNLLGSGEPFKEAATDAFRRVAANGFGIGRSLYFRSSGATAAAPAYNAPQSHVGGQQRPVTPVDGFGATPQQNSGFSTSPNASGGAKMMSPQQRNFILVLAKQRNMSPEDINAFVVESTGVPLDQLTSQAASALINTMKTQ